MGYREYSSTARRRHRRSGRLHEIEARLETAERRIVRLENTLKGAVREASNVSIGGPCQCGESLLIVRQRTMYCPQCRYRRTM